MPAIKSAGSIALHKVLPLKFTTKREQPLKSGANCVLRSVFQQDGGSVQRRLGQHRGAQRGQRDARVRLLCRLRPHYFQGNSPFFCFFLLNFWRSHFSASPAPERRRISQITELRRLPSLFSLDAHLRRNFFN